MYLIELLIFGKVGCNQNKSRELHTRLHSEGYPQQCLFRDTSMIKKVQNSLRPDSDQVRVAAT